MQVAGIRWFKEYGKSPLSHPCHPWVALSNWPGMPELVLDFFVKLNSGTAVLGRGGMPWGFSDPLIVRPTLEDLKPLAQVVAMEGAMVTVLLGLVRTFTQSVERNMNQDLWLEMWASQYCTRWDLYLPQEVSECKDIYLLTHTLCSTRQRGRRSSPAISAAQREIVTWRFHISMGRFHIRLVSGQGQDFPKSSL